jgi:RimJ/RimL family protein N-acetyltransferase
MTARATLCGSSLAAVESSVVANGTRISLRQVGADDRAGMAALFARLSPHSRYQRFFSPKHELTPRELTFFTDIDHLNHEAIAAVDQRNDSIVGVARYVRDPDRTDVAEVAVEVADSFQGMGIGIALGRLTIQQAQANGFALLTATTLWENRAARGLLRHHGFRARHSRGSEIKHELALHTPEPGDRTLDIGCGFGETTRCLAAHTGPHGVAVGVDASPRFIDAARRETEDQGIPVAAMRDGR